MLTWESTIKYWERKKEIVKVDAARNAVADMADNVYTAAELCEEMLELSKWCSTGIENVPRDAAKTVYWHKSARE